MKNDCADLRSRHLRMPPEHRLSFERRHAPSHAQRRGNLASQFRPPRDDRRTRFEPPIYARSEEQTSEIQSLMRISYAVFCLQKKNKTPHAPNILSTCIPTHTKT